MFSQIGFALINRGHFLSLPYYCSRSISLHPLSFSNSPTMWIANLFSSSFQMLPILLSSCYFQQMLRQNSRLYLTLGVWDMLAFPYQCTGFHIHTSKTLKLLSLQLSLPPLCHHFLNDRSVRLSYASQDRWIHLPNQWSGSDRKYIRKQF